MKLNLLAPFMTMNQLLQPLARILLIMIGMAGVYMLGGTPAMAQQYQKCANENGICRLPYPTEVIYGNGRRVTSKFINRPEVRCDNRTFGDPARGAGKSCSYVIRRNGRPDHGAHGHEPQRRGQWVRCAQEGQYCDFNGRKRVRYGTQHRFVEREFRNGVPCDNRTFGDPDRGAGKTCSVWR